jgi:N-acetylmuramoyl-L-alanine amidase/LysM repeat protein
MKAIKRFGAIVACLLLLWIVSSQLQMDVAAAPGELPSLSTTPTPTPGVVGVVLATPGPTPDLADAPRYTVKLGDTLYSIARAWGVTVATIQEANGIEDPNDLKAGRVIVIPGGTPPGTTPTTSATPITDATPTPSTTPTPAATAEATPAPAPQPQAPSTEVGDPLYFPETGFRIANEHFWNYFNRRGGLRTFGYPISKEFMLFGYRVQMFQRAVMQLQPDNSVTTMNLLDDGIMPYTSINFSRFPAPERVMADAAPRPDQDGYFDKLLSFVQDRSPNAWSDLPVSFYRTFSNTVAYEEAFPDGSVERGIMPAINLEIWGAPTSAPAHDPTNRNFVYLRFQRGIMHYDRTTGTTQGLLLGDYLKSIITGWNLPPDLDEQAKGSRFYRQYNSLAANGLNRPSELPGTDMRGAFARDGLVVLDPGHGGNQIGAAHVFPDKTTLVEKTLNLIVAEKTAHLLQQAGRQVLLTRTTDALVNNPPRDLTGDGRLTLDDDLMARIDLANDSGAAVLVSIHFNGSTNTAIRGAEVYYNGRRSFSDTNKKLAQMLLDHMLKATKESGYDLPSRGVKLDEAAVGQGNSFYLLGPKGTNKPRESMMPGALVEGAFLTNTDDAALVRQEGFLDALALGYARAIEQYFAQLAR